VLRAFQGDAEISTLETTTDAEGRFQFSGLDTNSALDYWPEVAYLDVTYGTIDPLVFSGDQAALETVLTVYETTGDESNIVLSSVHFIAQSFGEVLRLTEIHLFGNEGDRTYVGKPGDSGRSETVFLPLPSGAVGLAFEAENAEERFVEVQGGVYDTEPVPPGQDTALVFFSYHMMVTSDVIPLERAFAYPVGNLSGLVAQPGLELRSDALTDQGPQVLQDQSYQLFSAEGWQASTPLLLELVPVEGAAGQGMPGAGMPDSPSTGAQSPHAGETRGVQKTLGLIGLGLILLTAVAAVVFPLVSGQRVQARRRAPDLRSKPQARRLVAELADLEVAFDSGELDQVSYERQRSDKRRAIQSLWQ
jgi:hypothetical protein